jgi:hypothetical protein
MPQPSGEFRQAPNVGSAAFAPALHLTPIPSQPDPAFSLPHGAASSRAFQNRQALAIRKVNGNKPGFEDSAIVRRDV